jgi:hypothetical protein
MKCTHTLTTYTGNKCYRHPVAKPPYTEENPAAHGGVTYVQICALCGAQRRATATGGQGYVGRWSDPARDRLPHGYAVAAAITAETGVTVEAIHPACGPGNKYLIGQYPPRREAESGAEALQMAQTWRAE